MALFSRLKIWIANEVLSASDLNGEFNNILNNMEADTVVGSSVTVAAMKVTEDPGEVGTESLASSVEGEVRRIRNVLKEVTGKSFWYESPAFALSGTGTILFSSSTNPDVTGKRVLVVDMSGGSFTLEGLTGGIDGQILFVVKSSTSNTLTIRDTGTGTQKINNHLGGSNILLDAGFRGGVTLVFTSTTGTWIVLEELIDTNGLKALAVTGAKIAAATITGSNIAAATITGSNIASDTITGSNIASDTITADKIQYDTFFDSIASFTTTSTSFVDVGLSVTLTSSLPDGARITLSSGVGAAGGAYVLTDSSEMQLRIKSGATVIGIWDFEGTTNKIPLSLLTYDSNAFAPGTNTYTVEIKRVSGSGTLEIHNAFLYANEMR